MSLRIPQRIREEVDALANREGISRSLAIRRMIEQGLKK
jgi:metal-responsive CopG/Arc/MetJ family transcriptional regulator